VAQLTLHAALPKVCGDGRNRKAFLGQPDGWGQDPGHREPAVPLDQVAPPGARAGHCDRVRMEWRQLRPQAFSGKQFQRQRCRRATRSVERGDTARGGLVIECKTVATDSGRCRFGHVEGRCGSYCRIGRIASSCEDVEPGSHSQRLRSCYHAAPAIDRRAARSEDQVWHRLLPHGFVSSRYRFSGIALPSTTSGARSPSCGR